MADCLVIDLSHWNTVRSWADVKRAGVAGVIHKFSQGVDYRDDLYGGRCTAAKAHGLLWGRYHFGDGTNVRAQVDNFLTGWDPDAGELLALDYEDNAGNQMRLGQAREFVSLIFERTGQWPLLYSGNTLKDAIAVGGQPEVLTNCRLWLAQYGPSTKLPAGWDDWWLWQYTDQGAVDGIQGNVDMNRYGGVDVDQLMAEWPGTGPGTPAPVPEPTPEPVSRTLVAMSFQTPVTLVVSGDVEILRA
jgi:lysozyme